MLTNLEGQLKEQSAADRLDEVLAEIPKVREDLADSLGDAHLSDCRHSSSYQRVSGTRYVNYSESVSFAW